MSDESTDEDGFFMDAEGKYTLLGLQSKVDWEGGVAETMWGYGLGPEALSDTIPEDIREEWAFFYDLGERYRIFCDRVYCG